jgi:hypothetical protein
LLGLAVRLCFQGSVVINWNSTTLGPGHFPTLLLNHVGQLMTNDFLPFGAAGVVLARGKVNLPSLGESEGAEGLRIWPLVDSNL